MSYHSQRYGYRDERDRYSAMRHDRFNGHQRTRKIHGQDGYQSDYRGGITRERDANAGYQLDWRDTRYSYHDGPINGEIGIPPVSDFRDFRDIRDVRDGRDVRGGRDGRDGRDIRNGRDIVRDGRDIRDVRDVRDGRDVRGGRDGRKEIDSRDVRNIRDSRQLMDSRVENRYQVSGSWHPRDVPRNELPIDNTREFQPSYNQSNYVQNVVPMKESWDRMGNGYQEDRMDVYRERHFEHTKTIVDQPRGDRNQNYNRHEGRRDYHHRGRSHRDNYTNDNRWGKRKINEANRDIEPKTDRDHSVDTVYAKYHDKQGHYLYKLGESLGPKSEKTRYKMLDIIGEGTFGRVLICWDRNYSRYVAIKIVRAISKYTKAARIEINILKRIQESALKYEKQVEQGILDPSLAEHCCIKLLSWFEHKNHICMVFNRFGMSLYDFLKMNNHRPFDITVIREIGFQLFKCIFFMHNQLNLSHTDLKPENILFFLPGYNYLRNDNTHRVPKTTEIKLIDFGSATFENDHHSRVISTRHYRAPEVILKLKWSYPADIWSIGCILVELFTGNVLFQTHTNMEHLAMMERLLGPIPESLTSEMKSGNSAKKYFSKKELVPLESISSRDRVNTIEPLETMIPDPDFADLIRSCLSYHPGRRLTAELALDHPFFAPVKP